MIILSVLLYLFVLWFSFLCGWQFGVFVVASHILIVSVAILEDKKKQKRKRKAKKKE